MKRFLRELETRLATLSPAERAEISGAYLALIRGVGAATDVIGSHFKPSTVASLGLLSALTGSMRPGGGEALRRDLRILAPTIGPHVTALVQAL